MSEILTIMLTDLSTEAQREVLDFYGYQTPEEGNLDIVPLFMLEKDECERKEPSHECLQSTDSDRPDQRGR